MRIIDAQSNEEVIRQLDDPTHPIGVFSYAVNPDSGELAACIGGRAPFVELVEMLCHE